MPSAPGFIYLLIYLYYAGYSCRQDLRLAREAHTKLHLSPAPAQGLAMHAAPDAAAILLLHR
jgi:hypothetical protein